MVGRRFLVAGLTVLAAAGADAASDPAVVFATIVSATGLIRVQDPGAPGPVAATAGRHVPEGGKIITLENAHCQVRFTDGHFVMLAPLTTIAVMKLAKPGAKLTLLHMLKGHLRALIDKSKWEGDFGVYGATTITAVKGTDYDVDRPNDDDMDVQVNDGKVNVGDTQKDENDAAAIQQEFSAVLAGVIGMTLIEGNHMLVHRGAPLPKPQRVVQRAPGAGGAHGGREPRNGGAGGHEPHQGAGGAGHGHGGGTPNTPSAPGAPRLPGGFGFP